jgi:hypothetical protein
MSTLATAHRVALLVLAAGAAGQGRAVEAQTSSSSVHPGPFAAEYAFDGDLKTRWASESQKELDWVRVDFGRPVSIEQLVIHWEHAYAARYSIQLSDDGQAWRTVREIEGGRGGRVEHANLAGRGHHLRVLCLEHGPHALSSIWEIELPGGEAAAALEEARRKRKAEASRKVSAALEPHGIETIVFALRQPGRDPHWYANFGYYAHDGQPLYGPGGKLCRLDLESGEMTTLLEDAEGGVRDPVVHHDGHKILFSYREGQSPYYHLYEISADGTDLRQLTDGPYDDIEACYLPDGRIVFVSSRCERWVNCWLTQVAVLHSCDADGSDIRAISANIEHDNTPWVLPDGRILYQRWEYVDRSQVDYHHLWTTNPDGTGQMVYFGNLHPGTVMIDAKPIPGSDKVVAIFSLGHGRTEHDGQLTVVDPRAGPDDRRRARTIDSRTWRDPWAFSEELFMVSDGSRIVLLGADGGELELYRPSPKDVAAGLQVHEPRPLIRRPRERVIADRTDLSRSTGELILADVYEGRNMDGVERGEIAELLVLESLPKPVNFTGGMDPLTWGGSFTLERVVGTVPIEEDGSAYLEVPANRALFFVALDADGLAIKRMQSFLTVQPGEVLSCVGCHEPRTEGYHPARETPVAVQRPPSQIEAIDDCPDVFDFPRDIQPILDELCVSCHGYEETEQGGPYAGEVVLTGDRGPMFSHAYFSMNVKRIFNDNHNRAQSNFPPRSLGSAASRIFGMIDGSHHDVVASEHQRKILRLWIDVGGPYPGTYGALGNGSIGGYVMNQLVNTDFDWPTTRAGAEVIENRCASCHQGEKSLPRAFAEELGVSFWRFSLDDPRLQFSRHIVFNLTRPEKSLMLLAPLAEEAGGLALCRGEQPVFAGTDDAGYVTLLAMIRAGKENLEEIKRFDMEGFQPIPQYLREMRRYGILPADWPDDRPVSSYELDRKYWGLVDSESGQ